MRHKQQIQREQAIEVADGADNPDTTGANADIDADRANEAQIVDKSQKMLIEQIRHRQQT